MFELIHVSAYTSELTELPVIDVRSPSEFQKGHIPGAFNIPLFSDDERAIVGTAYKQQSKEKAIEIGLEFVQPKLSSFIEESQRLTSDKGIVIHCWRGGLRSQSFAEHLAKNGISKVYLIEGGYKAFRNIVLQQFELPYNLIVLGGYTGSGKTEILHEIKKNNQQVIDLEGVANHKGSAFGGFGDGSQSSSEQFENNLYWEWKKLDFTKSIWIEDESRNIGNNLLPAELYRNIREQKVIFIDIPRKERVNFLVEGYSSYSKLDLADAINRISRKIGGQNAQKALIELEDNNYNLVADLVLNYYDKRYLIGLQKRKEENIQHIDLPTTNHSKNALQLIKIVQENGKQN